jgi:homoserine O-acetyltransferase
MHLQPSPANDVRAETAAMTASQVASFESILPATLPATGTPLPAAAHAVVPALRALPAPPCRLQPVSDGVARVRLQGEHAPAARDVAVAWRLQGPRHAPVLAVLGGISADRRVAGHSGQPGWWQSQVAREAGFDPARWRILSIDWLDAATLAAPAVSSRDQADALAAVLDALGIARLHALVGASYGAMVGLHFAARHAARVQRLLLLAGAHRAHPQAAASRAVQRAIVRFGVTNGDAHGGLALARQLAMIGYRSPQELARRFDAAPELRGDGVRVASQDWLDAAAARFVERFDAPRYLALSESIDLHAIDPASVPVPTWLVAFDSDQLVPLDDLQALAGALPACRGLRVIASDYGHDAFLKETDAVAAAIRAVLDAVM